MPSPFWILIQKILLASTLPDLKITAKQLWILTKKDGSYNPQTYDSLKGIRMPDSIAAYTANGSDYVIIANEGDSRKWGSYTNEDERNFGKGKTSPTGKITAENSGLSGKVVFFDTQDYDGLDADSDYLFGGRSFTIFKVDENSLTEVLTAAVILNPPQQLIYRSSLTAPTTISISMTAPAKKDRKQKV